MTTIETHLPSHADGPPTVPPDDIMRIASGFMAAKHLFVASELGLFEALADAPADLDALAARTGLTRRAARISADAMVALGILRREGDSYLNTPASALYLTGRTPADLRPFLRFWDQISYPTWTGLSRALTTGPASEVTELSAELAEIASAGIEAVLAGPAGALAQTVDLSGHSRLLDLGGGTGSWSLAIAGSNAGLHCMVAELATVAGIARRRIEAAGREEQVEAITCDVLTDPLPSGYDAFLVANLVHYFDEDENRQLLTRIRAVAPDSAVLLLADFWTDPTHTEPVHAALMAGEFAAHLEHGDVYSVDEARSWLEATGWRLVEHRQLAGPQSLVIARPA